MPTNDSSSTDEARQIESSSIDSSMKTTSELLQSGIESYETGHLDRAATIYGRVLEQYPQHPDALHLMGLVDANQGRVTLAISRIREAVSLLPSSDDYYLSLIDILKKQDCYEKAELVAKEMTVAFPNSPKSYAVRAELEQRRGALEKAERNRRRAIELGPEIATYRGELGYMLEQQNRLEESERCVLQGLQREPKNLLCRLVLAKCLRRAGQVEEAFRRLETELEVDNAACQFELGRLCDMTGRYEQAWRYWERGNRLTESAEAHTAKPDRLLNEAFALYQLYQSSLIKHFSTITCVDPCERVFVSGFPRSGTSLVHHRLCQSNQVVGRHEPGTLLAVKSAMQQFSRGYPASIATLTDQQVSLLHQIYDHAFQFSGTCLQRQENADKRVILDTNPHHLIDAGLLTRLFPTARFVYMVRHPLDVVLSCFMKHFRLTDLTANFCSIERTVETYEVMMTLWRTTVQQLPHQCRVVRYEELIQSPENVLDDLRQWLGWPNSNDNSTDAQTTSNSHVGTASYDQVGQSIYRSAEGRWRNYSVQLAKIQQRLAPWIAYLGYQTDETST
jgi:tetratricopeptide (TPR) repeat protein